MQGGGGVHGKGWFGNVTKGRRLRMGRGEGRNGEDD